VIPPVRVMSSISAAIAFAVGSMIVDAT
jgi:hypothetical protein